MGFTEETFYCCFLDKEQKFTWRVHATLRECYWHLETCKGIASLENGKSTVFLELRVCGGSAGREGSSYCLNLQWEYDCDFTWIGLLGK